MTSALNNVSWDKSHNYVHLMAMVSELCLIMCSYGT